ncbi:MAG: ferrous iron transport protein A [Caulobacteraceae bacterium]|nr:FeoA family protein [Caulobacter sp.]RYF92813.1 MAG: ferrous iron transport protein A [Caulobacteraceae bacterium]
MSKDFSESASASGVAGAGFGVRGEPLGAARAGTPGVIVRVDGTLADAGVLGPEELERRLLELGFVEGARVEILQEGLFGRDPIAVKLDDMRVALRRREARAIEVKFD